MQLNNQIIGKCIRFLSVLAIASLASRAEELKIEQAIELALANNRDIANAVLDVAKAGDQRAAFRTKLLPAASFYALGSQQLQRMSFTIDKGTLGTYGSTGPIPNRDVNFSTPLAPAGFVVGRVVQPLSTIHRLRLNLKLFDLSQQIAQEQTRSKKQDVIRDVKRLYYSIQQVESALVATRETLKLLHEVDRLTGQYVIRQVALESDHLEAQTQLARTEQTELELTNKTATQKEQLNQLMGRDVLTEFTVTPVSEAAGSRTELIAARQQALELRPELRQARLKIEQAEQDVRVKRSEYIPDISAEFNTIGLLNFGTFLPRQTSSIGVSLSWDVFDWGRRKHELAEKRRTVEQARNTEADTKQRVVIDVNDKFRNLQLSRAQFRVARLGQATAVERLRVIQSKYAVQASLLRDVLEVQADLEQMNNNYQQALAKFWTARAEFEHAIGEDQ